MQQIINRDKLVTCSVTSMLPEKPSKEDEARLER